MPRPSLNFLTACITGKQRAIKEKKQHDKEQICENLPEELIIESILTRLPARTLAVCCCVSKSWYNSILNDSRFSVVHYNQNKSKVSLVFNLINVSRKRKAETAYFFSLLGRGKAMDIRRSSAPSMQEGRSDLVGFCNGLACMEVVRKPVNSTYGTISILNPTRGESLFLSYLRPTGGYKFLCHGFGFDSVSQVYKVVIIFTSEANDEYLCMVVTLGTLSWRKIVTRTVDISPPPGSFPFPSSMVTRVPSSFTGQVSFCGGDLFWRTRNKVGDRHTDMLLSFDLHDEKIRFIRLPELTRTTQITNDHLLEFKGYPCVARSTRFNNHYCGRRCSCLTAVCCCCYKVHMYILKDKEKQVWSEEETFDVQIMDQDGLLPTTLCCYFDTSTTQLPPTRMLTFSDQVLLYWFNGKRLLLYNLQEKHLKVVECSGTYPRIFRKRKNKDRKCCIGGGDNSYFWSPTDYQLHAQVENIVSLKTFIPKEAKISESHCADDLMQIKNLAAGWLTTGRTKHTSFYAFS